MSSIIVGLAAASAREPEPFDVDISTISYDGTVVPMVQSIVPSGYEGMSDSNVYAGEATPENMQNSRDGRGITVGQGQGANFICWEMLWGGGKWAAGNTELFETSYGLDASSFTSAHGGWNWIDSNNCVMYQDNTFDDHVFEKYTVSTQYDISTRSLNEVSGQKWQANTTHWHTMPAQSFFGDDTGSFVILADKDGLYKYNLSTAWDISTMPAVPNEYYQENGSGNQMLNCVFINQGGTDLFYTDSLTDQDIHHKRMDPPWDLTSLVSATKTTYNQATYNLITCDANAPENMGNSRLVGMVWNEFVNRDSHNVDVSRNSYNSVSLTGTGTWNGGVTYNGGSKGSFLRFNEYGTYCIVLAGDDAPTRLDLSTPWDISTAAYNSSRTMSPTLNTLTSTTADISDFIINQEGTRAFVLSENFSPDTIYQIDFSTAWDLTTASYSSVSIVPNTLIGLSRAWHSIAISQDGTKLYISETSAGKIYQVNLSTGWDLSTATFTSGDDMSQTTSGSPSHTKETFPQIYVNENGDFLTIAGKTTETIFQYDLTDGDINTATYTGKSYDLTAINANMECRGCNFNIDGQHIYVIDNDFNLGSGGPTYYQIQSGGAASANTSVWDGRGTFGDPAGKYVLLNNGDALHNMMRMCTASPGNTYGFAGMDFPSYNPSGVGYGVLVDPDTSAASNVAYAKNYNCRYTAHWFFPTYPDETGDEEYLMHMAADTGTQLQLDSWRLQSPGNIQSVTFNGIRQQLNSSTYDDGVAGIDITPSNYMMTIKETGSGASQQLSLEYFSINSISGTSDFSGPSSTSDITTWCRNTDGFTDTIDLSSQFIRPHGIKTRKAAHWESGLSGQRRLFALFNNNRTTGLTNSYVMRMATATSSQVNTSASAWTFQTGANYLWEVPEDSPGSGIDERYPNINGWDVSSDGSIILILTDKKLYKFTVTSPWNLGNSNIVFDSSVAIPLVGNSSPRGMWLSHDGTKLYVVDNNSLFYQYSFS
mgnify:FL=1